MRIIIDLQGAQSESRYRGIGRYTLEFSKALIRNRGGHEVLIALSGLFPETILPIREEFSGILGQDQVRVWYAPDPVQDGNLPVAVLIREAFLAELNPDVVIISSLLDEPRVVTSVRHLPHKFSVGVILYDLIPLIYKDEHLNTTRNKEWYMGRIGDLKKADFLLAISDSAKQEAVTLLGYPEERVVNIRADASGEFRVLSVDPAEESRIRLQYGLDRPFVLYTGGMDFRKNLNTLIKAFAALPSDIRCRHQLVIAGKIGKVNSARLLDCTRQAGLKDREVVVPGYIPDFDLVHLYNLCKLFVLPSLHEGFGLPVLEAMRCGAPVLGANTSSLPEIIGWKDALFDPRSLTEMSKALERGLTDERFRTNLVENGIKQAQAFSWDKTAKTALGFLETTPKNGNSQSLDGTKPRLAFVSPLPPERSGISHYSAELIPYLAEYYQIDVIVDQAQVLDDWIQRNCRIQSAAWFVHNSKQYDRVLYQFGNSEFYTQMFAMLRTIPGVTVLHDFYLSNLLYFIDHSKDEPGCFSRALLESHGYPPFFISRGRADPEEVIREYPCSLEIFQKSLGTVVHSPYAADLAKTWYGIKPDDLSMIPLLRAGAPTVDRVAARACLGLENSDFVVCSFGKIGPAKANDRLLSAWLGSALSRCPECILVFVGEEDPGAYGDEIRRFLDTKGGKARVRMTGWVDKSLYDLYLTAADVAVQLRAHSRGKSSRAALDCMCQGLATIVNNHGTFQDLMEGSVLKIPDQFTEAELIGALERLYSEPDERKKIGQCGREFVLNGHNPRTCAVRYRDALERAYHSAPALESLAIREISEVAIRQGKKAGLAEAARSMAQSIPPRFRRRRLFVDITKLVRNRYGTGIDRVVRNIVRFWIGSESIEDRIEPVVLDSRTGFRYARNAVSELFDLGTEWQEDPIDFYAGDIFIGLDWHRQLLVNHEQYLASMAMNGVRIVFVVYDLLPILYPQYFSPNLKPSFSAWLKGISKYGELYCISRTVADEAREWITTQDGLEGSKIIIRHFPLGADILQANTSLSLSERLAPIVRHSEDGKKVFLMVGTLEPRKGQQSVLDAFDLLWRDRRDVVLVIAGKKGWLIEPLINNISRHPQLNKLLFWYSPVSDQELHHLYTKSTALIAASYAEGYGLPLVEAAQHGLPIIARDIPIFREVAGDHAAFFSGENPGALASELLEWIALHNKGGHPKSVGLPWTTWEESAKILYNMIVGSEGSNAGNITSDENGRNK